MALLQPIDWQRCDLLIEYGPGVGTFTTHILDKLPANAKLLAIDTNPQFIEYLNRTITDPRFQAVLGSAGDVAAHMDASGHEHADYILSGLPFSALPVEQGRQIVEASHAALRSGGAFMTYQFRSNARALSAERFGRVESAHFWLNIPPCLLTWAWKQ
jgi:phospholipid N-methyltransferase